MPYRVTESGDCPDGKPFAVVKKDGGKVIGCHESKESANKQLRALYAKESRTAAARLAGDYISGLLLDGGLTAAASGQAPIHPPAEWFEDPKLRELTPLTVTPDGRIYGHMADWSSCHTGFPGQCVLPPKSRTGYAYFHLGEVETADGRQVPTGKITLGTGHASLSASRVQAAEHYDHTGAAVADIRVGEDRFGIWIAGAVRPELRANRLRELRAASLSGDWRRGTATWRWWRRWPSTCPATRSLGSAPRCSRAPTRWWTPGWRWSRPGS